MKLFYHDVIMNVIVSTFGEKEGKFVLVVDFFQTNFGLLSSNFLSFEMYCCAELKFRKVI